MATVDRFEDLECWKRARELTREVYAGTRAGEFARDFALRDQIRQASVAVMSNIAEGFDRGGNKEFRQFLSIAKGSAAEVKSQLYVALDAEYIDDVAFSRIRQLADESGQLIGGMMRYLRTSDIRGAKYKEPGTPTRNAGLKWCAR